MSSRMWLLVEWVDEGNMFPSYEVVNVDTLSYNETDLSPGNVIYIQLNHANPRRANILRISDSKRYVKEHKEILEHQAQQAKNVFQLCMRTIKGMNSDNSNVQYSTPQPSYHGASPRIIVASNVGSASDTESELEYHGERRPQQKNFNKSVANYPLQSNGTGSRTSQIRNSLNTSHHRRRSMFSSTPLPSSSVQKSVTFYRDQETQTEDIFEYPQAKFDKMERALKDLYSRFINFVARLNINSNDSTSTSEVEQHNEVSYVESNNGEPWPEHNITEHEDQGNAIIPDQVQDVGAEQVIEENSGDQSVNNSMKVEDTKNQVRVRRMSAQTTNNVETSSIDPDMVPIGNGNAKIPVRLLRDINWNSHTTATRQLLQAIFPRRVLATHSLTGKQSPAFLNRPPKKILDPKLVEDIVEIVSTRCNVPRNLVRNSITIKCTDEAKLYRNRMRHKMQRKIHNDENIPPLTPSSDESTNSVTN